MTTCAVCGQEVAGGFQITTGDSRVFDSFECAIHSLAPRCRRCGCAILGHGYHRDGALYCCFGCSRDARLDSAVDEASADSFPASDPPARSSTRPLAANPAVERGLRRQDGRVGWALLWLLGVPVPVLLVLFLARGCT
jgi:hypothetical protein